jgi:hypothetical protein
MTEDHARVAPPATESQGALQAASADSPVSDTWKEVLREPVVYRERHGTDMLRRLSYAYGALAVAAAIGWVIFTVFRRPELFGLSRAQGSWTALAMGIVVLAAVGAGRVYRDRQITARLPTGAPPRTASNESASNDLVIANYHQLTTRQSASSFRNSQIAMAVGLLILVTGAAAVLRAPDPARGIVVGSLTALGGAFSGYLSATFLRAHDRALEQVNYLFSQPLVSHYLDYSRKIAELLSTAELKDAALTKVVDRSLESAGVAVMTPAPEGRNSKRRFSRRAAAGDAAVARND